MQKHQDSSVRLRRKSGPSLQNWQKPSLPDSKIMAPEKSIDMGWGQLIFGQTFEDPERLAAAIRSEVENRRDIAFYIRDPHVTLSLAPNELFLDPSHTYRIWSHDYHPQNCKSDTLRISRLSSNEDATGINKIYSARGMVPCAPDFLLDRHATKLRTYYVAKTSDDAVVGTVTGIDHTEAFNDPENGCSLWCLAVDPQATTPGIGEALVRRLVEHYFTRGRDYVDLSVMHDNTEAIQLYEKIGFQRVPVFCIKRKNPINEKLYTAPAPDAALNPYARIITDEARRRGVMVEVIDGDYGLFRLRMGGRSVICRESLTEFTSAIAMSQCDDKRLTHRTLRAAGIRTPQQLFNQKPIHQKGDRWVVKPARGEQGVGISVDVRTEEGLDKAVSMAKEHCQDFLVEEYIEGDDLRIIVIDYKVVAGAVRKPPVIVGTGAHNVSELIEKYNRRRAAATEGESRVPIDEETLRCLALENCRLDTVIPLGRTVQVRKAANLHTGGTIHDVTADLNPVLIKVAEGAATALDIPVTGLDFIVPDVSATEYCIIEANERPGLANHEPQPTAERFLDYLFPQSVFEK